MKRIIVTVLLLAAIACLSACVQQTGPSAGGYAAVFPKAEEPPVAIAARADVDTRYEKGHTPLMRAAINGMYDAAEALLASGADPNADQGGWTPLMYAAKFDHADVAELLLRYRAEVDRKMPSNETALMVTASSNGKGVAAVLIKAGADVHAKGGESESTPLMYAASKGSAAVAELVLTAGAKPDARNKHKHTALLHAARNGHGNMMTLLLRHGANVNIKTVVNETPLGVAAENGHIEAAKLLLDAGADINIRGEKGQTPLMLAVNRGHAAMVSFLCERGADTEAVTEESELTALIYASAQGRAECVAALLRAGAKLETKDKKGRTALFHAIYNGQAKAVALLAGAGADLRTFYKADDSVGTWADMTPLMFAVDRGYVDCAEALLVNGADPNVRNPRGDKAVDRVYGEALFNANTSIFMRSRPETRLAPPAPLTATHSHPLFTLDAPAGWNFGTQGQYAVLLSPDGTGVLLYGEMPANGLSAWKFTEELRKTVKVPYLSEMVVIDGNPGFYLKYNNYKLTCVVENGTARVTLCSLPGGKVRKEMENILASVRRK